MHKTATATLDAYFKVGEDKYLRAEDVAQAAVKVIERAESGSSWVLLYRDEDPFIIPNERDIENTMKHYPSKL